MVPRQYCHKFLARHQGSLLGEAGWPHPLPNRRRPGGAGQGWPIAVPVAVPVAVRVAVPAEANVCGLEVKLIAESEHPRAARV